MIIRDHYEYIFYKDKMSGFNTIYFSNHWRSQRLKESNGFVSMRILPQLIAHDMAVYGNCIVQDYGKAKRIVSIY